jgi:ABC-2 type transport system ATP-binding protein
MRRRLDLAASLIGRPNVLFLDEPTTGLDPRSRQGMWEVIEDLVADGTTVLLTTQYLEEADQLANKIVVLNHGEVIAKGTSDELKSQVGGDRIELVVGAASDLPSAAELLREFGSGPATTEPEIRTLLLPVSGGSSAIVDVVRKLDENKINIADIALRRPTLDDVFLSLTGHAAEDKTETAGAPKGRRGRKARR